MTAQRPDRPAPAVLAAFDLAAEPLQPAASGLINGTWHARSVRGEARILQRVNPVFPPQINADIDALTRHLASRGLRTPRIVPTVDGALWLEHAGATWRALTAIEGVTVDALASPAQAREAGRVLAAFHRAVADFDRRFANPRLGVHDTPAHLAALRRALAEHADHPAAGDAAQLAERIFAIAARLPGLPGSPDRVVHGDPKISNILFDADSGRAVCLIDLDTLTRMPAALELGDAMRSWCNPDGEDAAGAELSEPLFEAAVSGYADAAEGLLDEAEWSSIPAATLTIAVELAARFCADALAERYFRWDEQRYASACAHNLARAQGQIELAASVESRLERLRAITAAAFAGRR